MPENENFRFTATNAVGNAIRSGSRAVADIATLGGNVRRYDFDPNVVEYDKILDDRKRYLTRLVMTANLLKIGEGFAQDARHLREVRFTPDPERDQTGQEKEVSQITEIPADAFNGCVNLNVVDWEALTSLQTIGANAFAGTAIREIPNLASLTRIEKGACTDCRKLRHVVLNDNVKYIGEDAFSGCKRLVNNDKAIFGGRGNFDLPKNLEYIGKGAFAGCKRIKKMQIPSSVKTISGNPFLNASCYKDEACTKLKMSARWKLWRTRIEIEGINKPLRAKDLEGMEEGFDGLRHVMLKGEHYIEQEPGKFVQVTSERYQAWVNQEAEKVRAYQVTPDLFQAYCKEVLGRDVAMGNITQDKIDEIFKKGEASANGKITVRFGPHDILEIDPAAMKKEIKKLADVKMAAEQAKKEAEPQQETPAPAPENEAPAPAPEPQEEKDKPAPIQLPVETNWDLNNLTLAQQQFLNEHGAANLTEFMAEHNIDPNDQNYVNNFFNSYAKNLGVPRMEDRQAETIRAIMEPEYYQADNKGNTYVVTRLPDELRAQLQQLMAEQNIDANNYEAIKALAYNPDNRELISAIADAVAPRQQGDEGRSK